MEQITEIVESAFKTGTSAKGDPYTLMKVKTSSGKTANIFAPAAIGDNVELSYNEQYKTYNAKKVKGGSVQHQNSGTGLKLPDTLRLDKIDAKLDKILAILDPQPEPDMVVEDIPDDINLDDVPFT